MRKTVTSPLGTAHTLIDLPFSIGGKSGSAQTSGNTKTMPCFMLLLRMTTHRSPF